MNNNNNNDDDFKSENFDQDFELDPVEIEDDFEDLEDFEDDNRLPLKKKSSSSFIPYFVCSRYL